MKELRARREVAQRSQREKKGAASVPNAGASNQGLITSHVQRVTPEAVSEQWGRVVAANGRPCATTR